MIFRYPYRSRISVLFFCIAWRAYIYHVVSCHLPNITLMSCYHLTSAMMYLTLIIITITGMMTWHLVYILIYSSTNRTPDTHDLFLLIPEIW